MWKRKCYGGYVGNDTYKIYVNHSYWIYSNDKALRGRTEFNISQYIPDVTQIPLSVNGVVGDYDNGTLHIDFANGTNATYPIDTDYHVSIFHEEPKISNDWKFNMVQFYAEGGSSQTNAITQLLLNDSGLIKQNNSTFHVRDNLAHKDNIITSKHFWSANIQFQEIGTIDSYPNIVPLPSPVTIPAQTGYRISAISMMDAVTNTTDESYLWREKYYNPLEASLGPEESIALIPIKKLVKDYFPYYHFSKDEQYYPTSFYFDNDAYVENNHENYNNRVGNWNESYVYVHTVDDGEYFTIQYWLYYAYNYLTNRALDFLFHHEHDWESVYVVFEKENLTEPLEVRYSYHDKEHRIGGIEAVSWDDVNKINNYPIVYVANGTHASYWKDKVFLWLYWGFDRWKQNSFMNYSNFNIILVKDETGEIQNDNTFCYLNFDTIKGTPQQEPKQNAWPRYYKGEVGLVKRFLPPIEAPWHGERWNETQPNSPIYEPELNNVSMFGVLGDASLHVYDSFGNHTGINETGDPEAQIPHSKFFYDEEAQLIIISDPQEEDYEVRIIGLDDGTYDFGTARTAEGAFISAEVSFNNSITRDENITFSTNPSMISLTKVFNSEKLRLKQRRLVRPQINVTNVGFIGASKINVTDEIPQGWELKKTRLISIYLYDAQGKRYKIPSQSIRSSVIGNDLSIEVNFSAGIEIGEGKNKRIIYQLEPSWNFLVKYPLHPPGDFIPKTYSTKTKVIMTTIPLEEREGISIISSKTSSIEVG